LIFKDSGGGIDDDIINKVFEPYYTTKHQSRGTGIGLYMTHQIITKHLSGTIEVMNKEYIFRDKKLKGAEFSIKIPIKD
jgi:signal transduction histidine kinase